MNKPKPKRGMVIGTICRGTRQYEVVADGKGDTFERLSMFNCKACGYVVPDRYAILAERVPVDGPGQNPEVDRRPAPSQGGATEGW